MHLNIQAELYTGYLDKHTGYCKENLKTKKNIYSSLTTAHNKPIYAKRPC